VSRLPQRESHHEGIRCEFAVVLRSQQPPVAGCADFLDPAAEVHPRVTLNVCSENRRKLTHPVGEAHQPMSSCALADGDPEGRRHSFWWQTFKMGTNQEQRTTLKLTGCTVKKSD
jgi:hypothetical protein